MILYINGSVRGGERVHHQKIAVTLENLKRKIVIGYARNSQHVAFGFGVSRRPLCAVFVTLFQRFRQIRNRTSTNNALPRRNRRDRAELPEVLESFG